jgi:ferredoxin/flavodoxin---NADP+ reductase
MPLHVAVVGSGPSGFYAAEAMMRKYPAARIDMFDRLPTPFGLVRGGVAPDHPKIKQVCAVYDKLAKSESFAFLGNVQIGVDVDIEDLRRSYHIVIVACGASADRRLNIPGEHLSGSHAATEFVGWYNGHPDYQDRIFDLSHEAAVVIGHGNVAADVARILMTPVDMLRTTDISEAALDVLTTSRIKEIHIVGRRGPAQTKFTPVELRELGSIPGCTAAVDKDDLRLNPASESELSHSRSGDLKRNFETLLKFSGGRAANQRGLWLRFFATPVSIDGDRSVRAVTFATSVLRGEPFAQIAVAEAEQFSIPCGLVFRSVGYKGLPLPGLPFDDRAGVIPNTQGRCLAGKEPIPGVYVTGWIKRGPSGIIGTNRADSIETVDAVVEDMARLDAKPKLGLAGLRAGLLQRRIRTVNYSDWLVIDGAEQTRGHARGKPREKFRRVSEMIDLLQGGSPSTPEK